MAVDNNMDMAELDPEVFAAWADALTTVAPPQRLRERVLSRIHALAAPSAALRTVRADEGWTEFAPGIRFKMLYRDEVSGTSSLLARLDAGVTMPEHTHKGVEECYVVEGELTYGDLTIRAGDYHVAAGGAQHVPMTTSTGALVYLRCAFGQHVPEASA
jgi:anti-sigma factor ChrR (cupin superfamily)